MSKSSQNWLKEHETDEFVKRAKQDGWRTRASFKLLEIDEKDRLFSAGMQVLDLGSAPGGWSQVAAQKVGDKGRVIASDILPMQGIAGVKFIQGDFTEQKVFDKILDATNSEKINLVISDMAPNLTGVSVRDQAEAFYLAELALDMAQRLLLEDGTFLVKVFQGSGLDEFKQAMQASFKKVLVRKPKASRDRSKEIYLLGKGFIYL